MEFSLDLFSTEILLKIFKYLDIYDLCKLKQTCKRFKEIVNKWDNVLNNDIKPLVTNQQDPSIIDRSHRLLKPCERMRISRNWRLGIFKETSLLYSKIKYIPWLQLEKNLLWVSRGGCIRAYQRNSKGVNPSQVAYTVKKHSEICRFVKKGDLIVFGQMDGCIKLWSVKEQRFIYDLIMCHDNDVNAIDMSDIIVSGSRDNWVKFWSMTESNLKGETQPALLDEINLHDRIWSVALCDKNKSLLAIGTAGISSRSTVTVYDMIDETALIKFNSNMYGAGVLDIKWESDSILWSCGYDSNVRRWDLRTGKCEQVLSDPCGATIYCFQYDYFNTIVSGTQSNGRAVLWDTRQNSYVQMYFMSCCQRRDKSSPIYSLSFDAEFLFTVTDQHINVLDFSVLGGDSKDYGNLCFK